MFVIIYHCRPHFTQSTDQDRQSRKQLCLLKFGSAEGMVNSVILQSLSSIEGLPDSLLEEFDPSGGICLPRSTPCRAVSLGCRRYPYAWNGQAGGWRSLLGSKLRQDPETFRLSFCICPCTYIYKEDRHSCLSPVPVCPYGCHLAGLQLAWPALPSTDRWLVTQFSGRTWGTHYRAEARGRQP